MRLVHRTTVAVGAAEADIGLAEVEDIELVVGEEGIGLVVGIGPGGEERHMAVAVGDKDCGLERHKVVTAGDMDYALGEGVVGDSHVEGAAGHTGLEGGNPEADRSLEEALVVVERRSFVAADILVGDIDLVEAADNQVAATGLHMQDIHHVVGDTTYLVIGVLILSH